MVAGGEFISYCNHQLIKCEEDRDSDYNKKMYYEKREITTFKEFPCEILIIKVLFHNFLMNIDGKNKLA